MKALVEKSKKIIKKALKNYKTTALVASGGKDSTVMLDLVFSCCNGNVEQPIVLLCDPIPIKENVVFCKQLIKHYGIKRPVWYHDLIKPYLKRIKEPGKNKVKCCNLLKIKPLNDFIRKFKIDALFVAIRWDEHPERAKETYFSPRQNPKHMRVHPMLHFSWLDVWLYIKHYKVPFNPLYLKGYTSLGCRPCTSKVKQDGFKDLDEIIRFVKERRVEERAGRDIDKELVMERLRSLGYF